MRLYSLAFIAKVIAIISMTLYIPLHILNCVSDYLFQYSGCADLQEEDEQDIVDEMNNNEEEKEEDYD